MSLSIRNDVDGSVLEKVILESDLSKLSSVEKVHYVNGICKTLGLNPVTQPIALMKFNGKEIPYVRKDGTEQLRKLNKVSVNKIETKLHDGGLYVVTAYANLPDGRQDSSTGAISVLGLKGDALANAMMKAETKAKRRVTLSICGLGFMDESEAESLIQSQKIELKPVPNKQDVFLPSYDIDEYLLSISQCDNLDDLQEIFSKAYKHFAKTRDSESVKKIILAKDKKKSEIEISIKDFNEEIEGKGEVK